MPKRWITLPRDRRLDPPGTRRWTAGATYSVGLPFEAMDSDGGVYVAAAGTVLVYAGRSPTCYHVFDVPGTPGTPERRIAYRGYMQLTLVRAAASTGGV